MSENPPTRQKNYLTMILKNPPSDELFFRKFRIPPVFFHYLPDSNTNFRPARINSELISGRTVHRTARAWVIRISPSPPWELLLLSGWVRRKTSSTPGCDSHSGALWLEEAQNDEQTSRRDMFMQNYTKRKAPTSVTLHGHQTVIGIAKADEGSQQQ